MRLPLPLPLPLLLLLVAGVAAAQSADTVRAPAGACPALRTLRLPDVRITAVDDVRAQSTKPPNDNVRVPYCRVSGVTGKAIRFVVALPDVWNARLYMGGNGGFAGTLALGALAQANQGYVAVTTDTGHDDSKSGA